jgi:putative transposase
MLTDHEFLLWFRSVHLPDRAKPVITQIRMSEPSRRVRSTVGNVCGRYPSRKMGRTIQFESHRNELATILEYEHSKAVLEFWDQPPAIQLAYLSKHGRRLGVCHTPDFFVLHAHGAGWEECKVEEDLQRLTIRSPHRYVRGADGQWRCPPAEQYAAIFGLTYRVRSSAEIHWIYQRNMLFLEDYWRGDRTPVDRQTQTAIQALVAAHPGITLAALLDRAPGTPDDLYQLIVMEELFIDLHAAPLAEPAWVQVFGDAQTARSLSGHSPTLREVLKEVSTVSNAAARDRLAQASPADLERALSRYTVIRPCLYGEPCGDSALPARTLSRWLALYREAEASYGAGLLGLIPRRHARGNRAPRLPEQTRLLMQDYIQQHYETLKQPSINAVYGAFVRACEARALAPPTYATFCTYVRRQPRTEQIRKRQGDRAAMPLQPCYLELTLSTPRHGDRPFEICHIDHTELDIELVCSRTGRNLGRPWATFLSDTFSRRLLAVFLTYDPPSYRSCMMVIRECVRRHGRFPQSIIIDGGREFDSVYFDTLLARYECTKKTRPPAQPRFGSVCERLFGVANTQFLHNLAGNTQMTKRPRQLTRAVDPKRHAVWTLAALYERLCEWAYDVHDTLDHPALGQSPREAFAAARRTSGERPQRAVVYDEEFWLWTFPTTARGKARVVPGRGVKVNYIFYWSSAFRDPAVEQTLVPVRYDPYNAGTAFAYVGTRWVECLSEHYASLRGRSERELMVASAELRKRAQTHARQYAMTARRLADFLTSVEAEELLRAQRLRDREAHSVLRLIDGSIGTLPPGSARDASDASRDATPRQRASIPSMSSAPTLHPDQLHVYEEY